MGELLEPAVKERIDPGKLRFDDPLLESRFAQAGREAATLKDEGLKPSVTTLSQHDRSMKVRQAALEALKVMG